MMKLLAVFIFLAITSLASGKLINQEAALQQFRINKLRNTGTYENPITKNVGSYKFVDCGSEEGEQDLLRHGLPGQPTSPSFNQYAGYIDVDRSKGRALFYYFAESANNSSTKPLILWLNGGPMCSSLGMGAMTEIGPFGVNPDGKTLYARKYSWNQVASVIFLESPAGVGFSYSNTTSDYFLSGDRRTAADTYVFLLNWFKRHPLYQHREFYLIGESYAVYYVPELAQIIIEKNRDKGSAPMINLRGIMIGNGLIHDKTDSRGTFDYLWSHALISDENHQELLEKCPFFSHEDNVCAEVFIRVSTGMGNIDAFSIYSQATCDPSGMMGPSTGEIDPCDLLYVNSYLNLPQVQKALHANRTNLPYPWAPCSIVRYRYGDVSYSMFPIYRKLMGHGLRILLYSGDADATVPVTGTRYSLAAMGIKVIKPWQLWTVLGNTEVAGYKVIYDGLEFVTVQGGGHEVSRTHPHRLYALLEEFLGS